MYYKDLTEYKYSKLPIKWLKWVNIGWLDREKDYSKGKISKLFCYSLFIMSTLHINAMMGYHKCSFCETTTCTIGTTERKLAIENTLGSAEIWIIGINGVIYVAPNLIYHYVSKHQYKPPFLFIVSTIICGIFYFPFFLLWCGIFYFPSTVLSPKKSHSLYRGGKLIKPIKNREDHK